MSKIYTGQNWRLTLIGRQNVVGGTATIQYRRVGLSTIQEQAATIDDPTIGSCYVDFAITDFTVKGLYHLWLKLTFATGDIGYGEPYAQRLYAPGS